MEEAPENSKESSHSAHANGVNEIASSLQIKQTSRRLHWTWRWTKLVVM